MLERTARPLRGFGNWLANLLNAIFRGLGGVGRFLQDLLNGSWLGHSLHAVLVDVVIGAATAALLLDILRVVFGVDGLETATTWVVGLAWLAAAGSILSGLTDFKDTSPDSATRDVTTLHGVTNIVGTVGLAVSTLARTGGSHDLGFWTLLIGYAVLSAGAFIGGHIVFKHGYTVDRNAFSRGKRAKEFTAVTTVAELPEATPTKVALGATSLMLVRRGDLVHALKDTCSHAGGPLSQGSLDGNRITCPWHASVFDVRDGSVKHGPATSRQVRYEARISGDQVEVRGPHV